MAVDDGSLEHAAGETVSDSVPGGSAECLGSHSQDELFQVVYEELYAVATSYMRDERDSHTLTPTALLNETYLKLKQGKQKTFEDKSHFAATAARTMRYILVNHARAKKSLKRGAHWTKTSLDTLSAELSRRSGDIETLHRYLEELEELDPLQRQLVDLRFFGGFSMQEAARILEISERAAYYEWSHVRAWLRCQMQRE